MIREATLADADALAPLMGELGYPATTAEIEARLAPFMTTGEPPLVWDEGGTLLAVLVWHVTPNLHRSGPVGRTVALVVSEAARGGGVGRALVTALETRCRAMGCVMMEVSSNMRRGEAHRFYEGLGYARSSYKFAKDLEGGAARSAP